jgi:signal transduction histidine kinase
MDRLFLRVYLNLLAAMLVGVTLVRVFVIPRVEDRVGRNIEETFSPAVAVMAEMLAEDSSRHDTRATLERASARFGAPVEVVPRAALPLTATELSRVDRGEIVRTAGPFQSMVFTRIAGTDSVLQIGPVNSVHPYGGLRGAAMLVLFVGALSAGVYTLLRPIRRRLAALSRAATALGGGDLDARAEVGSADAIGTVAAAFNGMADQVQRLVAGQEELLHITSHELRTPLQRLHFTLERLRSAGGEEAANALDRMDRDLSEMDELIEELLAYVRLKERRPELRANVDVAALCGDVCDGLAGTAPGVTLTAAPRSGIELEAEARLVRRAVSNLVVNALRHARGRVEVAASRRDGVIHIDVDDDGAGIAAADRERIFEPFVRLDGAGESVGFGLGLAIVRRIAEMHGGSVEAGASPLGGARFRIAFPEAS